MGNVSKDLLREYIKDQKFSNANEVLDGLKEMFKDVLQESLEAEMDIQKNCKNRTWPCTA